MDKKKKLRELENFKETQLNEKYENISFTVILVRPEHSGNVGSIARVMKNFNFENLAIFNPIENIDKILSYETYGYAMHGKDILLNANIVTIENQKDHLSKLKNYLNKYDLIIATTAKGKKHSNIKRLAIFPQDFSIPYSEKPLKIAILFGKESRGLTNEEIRLADVLLRIPASEEYPSLNLSHGCGIILYEIFKKINILSIGRGKKPVLLADKEDRVILYTFINDIIEHLKIRTFREDNVFQAFKNVFERAFISKKELSLILGLFSKVDSILKEVRPYEI